MMLTNKVTVIIPVYNSGKYISKCIESVLSQTYKNIEIILVNDGSKDNSGEICEKYKSLDKRIQVFHRVNSGVSASRNYGISKSTGKYICFIDSDDWIESRFIENFFKNGIEIDYQFVTQGILFDDLTKTWPFFEYDDQLVTKDNLLISKNKIIDNGCPVGKLFKREILEKYEIEFPNEISFHEDHVFVLKYINHVSKLYLVSGAYYHYMKIGEVTLSSNRKYPNIDLCIASRLMFDEFNKIVDVWRIKDRNFMKNQYSLLVAYHIYKALHESNYAPTKQEQIVIKKMTKQLLSYPLYIKYYVFCLMCTLNVNWLYKLLHYK